VPFFVVTFSHAYNHTHKKIKLFGLYEKVEIFFQDWALSHRVAFKRLHKGLQPFIGVGLHKKGVWSPSDV